MVKCFSSFMEICYVVRRNAVTAKDLTRVETEIDRFHELREIFVEVGVRTAISLPRQHALMHYPRGIRYFGSLNGICSTITESKHIKAVKEPWRRSSRYDALYQMLRTISRGEQLSALHFTFASKGMLRDTTTSYTAQELVARTITEEEGLSDSDAVEVDVQESAHCDRSEADEATCIPDSNADDVRAEDGVAIGGREEVSCLSSVTLATKRRRY
jgi:hypothetical protein